MLVAGACTFEVLKMSILEKSVWVSSSDFGPRSVVRNLLDTTGVERDTVLEPVARVDCEVERCRRHSSKM